MGFMMSDAIREALEAARDAWAAVQDGPLDEDGKAAAQKEIDDAILSLEEAARLALVETV